MTSYDWTLKHLKLVALHSVNHSLQSQIEQHALRHDFESKWVQWVDCIIAGAHLPMAKLRKELDVFTSTSNWEFSAEDEEATRRFEVTRLR